MSFNFDTWKWQIGRFLTAQTISLFGSSLVQYAIVWYITLTTSSGVMLTISTLCGFLPQLLIAPLAGVWIDRYDRKKIIMLADGLIAMATLILAVTFLTGHKNIWLLFLVLMVRSAGTGVQTPAVSAIIPQVVPKEHLMKIQGINSTISSLIMFLSPAVSGVILSVASLEATLFVDVTTAIIGISITFFISIRPYERMLHTAQGSLEQLKNGFAYLKQNPFVRRLLAYQLTILFFISPSAFLTPLMVSRVFGAEVWRLTVSEMTYSLGMTLGGILIVSWGGFSKRMNTAMLAGAAYGLLMIGLGTAPLFLIYLLCNAMIGITAPCYNAPITVSIQERVEPSMQGRVFSFMQISTSCALPLGMALFGPLADILPVQLLLITGGAVVIVYSAVAFFTRHFDVA